jgi:DNA-binding MarR family transcriptional regulator
MLKIMKLSSHLTATYARIYTPRYGIGIPEWRILAVLGFFGPLPLIRISEYASIDRGTITKAAERLRLQGAITIDPDRFDHRRKIASLTDKGADIHDKIASIANARHERLREFISDQEYGDMLKMLEKLDQALEAVNHFEPADRQ